MQLLPCWDKENVGILERITLGEEKDGDIELEELHQRLKTVQCADWDKQLKSCAYNYQIL